MLDDADVAEDESRRREEGLVPSRTPAERAFLGADGVRFGVERGRIGYRKRGEIGGLALFGIPEIAMENLNDKPT